MAPDFTLHHFPLDPFSRQARLALGEKRVVFIERVERYWERPETLEALNPSGMTPVLIEGRGDDRLVVCEIRAVLEHIEERGPEPATPAPQRRGPGRGAAAARVVRPQVPQRGQQLPPA